METVHPSVPALAWLYGAAGLIPFVGCAAADIAGLAPGHDWWRVALLSYSVIILSFLGGGRWGMELALNQARKSAITLSMLPSVAGFALLLSPCPKLALGGAAAAHVLQWVWDVLGSGTPMGYGFLRSGLASGAVLSIVAAMVWG